jgi:antitoxin MazE
MIFNPIDNRQAFNYDVVTKKGVSMTVRSKVIRIGNSRGIRIPRTLLEQAGLTGEVEMFVEENKLIIRPVLAPRFGWEAQFSAMAEHGDDQLLDQTPPTRWDEDEWTW